MGYQVKTIPYSLPIGKEFNWAPNLQQLIKECSVLYDFIIIPLIHPRLYRTEKSVQHCPLQLTRGNWGASISTPDYTKSGGEEGAEYVPKNLMQIEHVSNAYTYGNIKPDLDLESPVQHIRDRAEYCFTEEIELAEYLKIDTVLVDLPIYPIFAETKMDNMCRIMNQYLPFYPVKVMVRVPMVMYSKNDISENKANIAWKAFQKFKRLCNFSTQINLCIDLTREICDDQNIERWWSENLKMVTLSKDLFLTNMKGFPVLSKAHQRIVKKFMTYKVKVVLKGSLPHNNSIGKQETMTQCICKKDGRPWNINWPICMDSPYHRYICHLFRNHAEYRTEEERTDVQYQNYLQQPLQPLMNNLSSGTYEVFEHDTMKYYRYEQAIQAALVDFKTLGKFSKNIDYAGPPNLDDEGQYYGGLLQKSELLLKNQAEYSNGTETPVQVMVFGAGRGPLIIRALNASRNTGVPIQITAVEKNRYAIISIKNLLAENGIEDQVKLIHGDMREVDISIKADIIVSELLGSFGDNELSPECLFPVQKFMHADSISIPCYYRSQIAPISSQVLWNEAKLCQEVKDPFSVGYVVYIFSAYYPCEDEVKNVFGFTHPMPKLHKNMFAKLSFVSKNNAMLHGFAGFFETQLYDKVWLSIKPGTHTPTMRSWFPMYFPINKPVVVSKGSTVTISIWRLTKSFKVWYEWSMSIEPEGSSESNYESDIHNVNGEHYWIGSTI